MSKLVDKNGANPFEMQVEKETSKQPKKKSVQKVELQSSTFSKVTFFELQIQIICPGRQVTVS